MPYAQSGRRRVLYKIILIGKVKLDRRNSLSR